MSLAEKDPLLAMLDMLERPIAFHCVFATVGGGAVEGLLLSQAFYWSKTATAKERDGWFYHSYAEWEDETALTRREQQTARKHLRERGLLEERIGVQPGEGRVVWFRVNRQALSEALKAIQAPEGSHKRAIRVARKRPTPLHESAQPIAPKRPTPPISAETTPETTQRLRTHVAQRATSAAAPASNANSVRMSGTEFPPEQRMEYALAHPQSINRPEQWVWSKRTCVGEFDPAIRVWLNSGKPGQGSAATARPRDTSACTDCHGEGYYFENPADARTHRRCNHPRLARNDGVGVTKAPAPEAQP